MGRSSRRYLVTFLVCVIVLVLHWSQVHKLQNVYRRKIRIPIAIDHIRQCNSTCSLHADRRGYHQKVFSYSIYGDLSKVGVAKRYLNPLKKTIRHINRAFPGTD